MSLERLRARQGLLLAIAAAAVLSLVLAACGSSSSDDTTASSSGGGGETTSAESKEPIKIAYPDAQTGYMAFYDEPIGHGMELAIEDVNKKGGVLGGRDLELVIGPDNKTDINYVREAALEALSKNPDFLFTSCDYDIGGPQARAADEQGVLAMGCAGSVNYGLEGLGPLVFNTGHGNPTEAAVLAQFTAEKFPKAYFITDTSSASTKEACEEAEGYFQKQGGTIVGDDTMNNSDASFAAQVDRFRQNGGEAEAVVLCSYVPGGPNMIKQLRAAGVEAPIVGSAALGGSTWYTQVPDLGDYYSAGEVASLNGDDPDQRKDEVVQRYVKKYGELPSTAHMLIGYAGIEALAKAIEDAGSTEAEAVKEALQSFQEVPLLVGKTTYTPKCHIALGRTLAVLKANGDHSEFVEDITPKEVNRTRC